MVGWHHRLNGHESEQVLGDSEGQGSLSCCSSWGGKERLNNHNKAGAGQGSEAGTCAVSLLPFRPVLIICPVLIIREAWGRIIS